MDLNPLQEFHERFCKAQQGETSQELNAMMLTTISGEQQPQSRMVLLKKYDWDGFTFFTNYDSVKSIDIAAYSKVNVFFNWSSIQSFISVSGTAIRIHSSISDNYFEQRPRLSKLSAHASFQSKPIVSRTALEEQFKQVERSFNKRSINRPSNWGGFLIKPVKITFTDVKGDVVCTKTYRLNSQLVWKLTTTYTAK